MVKRGDTGASVKVRKYTDYIALEKYGIAAFSYPTGCGKSFSSLKYIEDYLNYQQKRNTLIVVPYNIIADQFKDYIEQYVDNRNKRLKNKNIMVITYSKLALWMKYAKDYEVDIAIFDEAQMLGAETYEPAFEKLREQCPEAKMTEEQKKESSFSQRWRISPLKKALDIYADKDIEEIPIKWRNQISILRENGIFGKTKQERIIGRLKKSVARNVEYNSNVREKIKKSIRKEKDKLV